MCVLVCLCHSCLCLLSLHCLSLSINCSSINTIGSRTTIQWVSLALYRWLLLLTTASFTALRISRFFLSPPACRIAWFILVIAQQLATAVCLTTDGDFSSFFFSSLLSSHSQLSYLSLVSLVKDKPFDWAIAFLTHCVLRWAWSWERKQGRVCIGQVRRWCLPCLSSL